jgi:hypothetical protein
MSERFQRDLPDFRLPERIDVFQPLPGWLADRLLGPDEKVTWVRGPRFNPSWERYVTHPALFLLAIAMGAIAVALARLFSEEAPQLTVIAFLVAGVLVVFSVIVLGIANGYFTRLVVTSKRLVILQGYEICRSWDINWLPFSLRRYAKVGEQESWTVDLDAVKSMLGGSDKFTDAKTILSFGKQLDRITIRDKDRS